jgi:hypothetical protein
MHAFLTMGRHALLVVAALIGCAGSGCSRGPSEPVKAARAVEAESTAGGSAETPQKVNLEAIFPPGRGRELALNNCTTCHTIVPIVVLQMNKEAWERNSRDHRERVKGLSDAEFRTLYEYLKANFNPERPVPKLPQALLETWTSY